MRYDIEEDYRESDHIFFDRGVYNRDGQYELAHHTGRESLIEGVWCLEYVDSYGDVHFIP